MVAPTHRPDETRMGRRVCRRRDPVASRSGRVAMVATSGGARSYSTDGEGLRRRGCRDHHGWWTLDRGKTLTRSGSGITIARHTGRQPSRGDFWDLVGSVPRTLFSRLGHVLNRVLGPCLDTATIGKGGFGTQAVLRDP